MKINDLVDNFQVYLNKFVERYPYAGPPQYFHERVIDRRRSISLKQCLYDNIFMEYLYAVLVAWGMHNMRGGPKMKNFAEFRGIVQEMGKIILPLQNTTIAQFNEDNFSVFPQIFEEYTVMNSKKRLVGNSKVLHHLLPDLVPIIDEKNILNFLDKKNSDGISGTIETFNFVMQQIKDIYIQIDNRMGWDVINSTYNGPMKTSNLKLIDNAIVGYIIVNEKTTKEDRKEESRRRKEEKRNEQEEFKKWRKSSEGIEILQIRNKK